MITFQLLFIAAMLAAIPALSKLARLLADAVRMLADLTAGLLATVLVALLLVAMLSQVR